MSARSSFELDGSGVIEIAKSAGMRAALADAAAGKCAEANAMLRSHDPRAGGHGYMSRTKVLDRTAIGMVHTAGVTTELDQRRHHTLDAINH
ncbi:hypothetical protein FIC87_12670 [Eggerthella lenta]|uniref:Uncharacterized protein n=1 Tax=Eggerthella lenta TaxID=84112 RepID=A0A5C5BS98_EGGLN|nr:hypothetical protein [Eggerthella lenta]TNU89047.1 hypothetical protein FIC87_12670 [Eggerthella lenta]